MQGHPNLVSLTLSEDLFPEFLIKAVPPEQREAKLDNVEGGMMSSSGDMTLSLSNKDIQDMLDTDNKGLSRSELYRRMLEQTEPKELLMWESKQMKPSKASAQIAKSGDSMLEDIDEGIKNQVRFFLSIAESEGVSSRDIGRYLQERRVGPHDGDISLLNYVKNRHGNLFAFLRLFPSIFQVDTSISKGTSEYLVRLVSDEINEDDEDDQPADNLHEAPRDTEDQVHSNESHGEQKPITTETVTLDPMTDNESKGSSNEKSDDLTEVPVKKKRAGRKKKTKETE